MKCLIRNMIVLCEIFVVAKYCVNMRFLFLAFVCNFISHHLNYKVEH